MSVTYQLIVLITLVDRNKTIISLYVYHVFISFINLFATPWQSPMYNGPALNTVGMQWLNF